MRPAVRFALKRLPDGGVALFSPHVAEPPKEPEEDEETCWLCGRAATRDGAEWRCECGARWAVEGFAGR